MMALAAPQGITIAFLKTIILGMPPFLKEIRATIIGLVFLARLFLEPQMEKGEALGRAAAATPAYFRSYQQF